MKPFKNITERQLKKLAKTLGADLCGIASAERFAAAPKGFHPKDIFSATRSVVVVAARIPEGVMLSKSFVPYTKMYDILFNKVFSIAVEISVRLQDAGIISVPIPSEPYEYWDAEAKEGRGILSLRHAGCLAGLGVLGKNTLLINELYGNRIVLAALLADAEWKEDPLVKNNVCPENCTLCLDSCPVNALDGTTAKQKNCRPHAEITTPKGYNMYACFTCRKICPSGRGKMSVRLI